MRAVLHSEYTAGTKEALVGRLDLDWVFPADEEGVVAALVDGAPVLLTAKWNPAYLVPELRWVQGLGAGYEQFPIPDLEAAGIGAAFWLGILLILLFAVQLGWFPSAADYVSLFESPREAIRLALMPAIAMGVYASGVFARFLRASTAEVLDMDHVRTARSKGISRFRVLRMHVVRNALLPFVTVVGLRLGALISGSVVIEVVFNYPGLGRLLVTAIGVRDYPVIQSVFLLVVIIFALVNLLVDLAYAYADPRIRYGD